MKKNVLAFAVLFCLCNVFAVQTENSGFSIEPLQGLEMEKSVNMFMQEILKTVPAII